MFAFSQARKDNLLQPQRIDRGACFSLKRQFLLDERQDPAGRYLSHLLHDELPQGAWNPKLQPRTLIFVPRWSSSNRIQSLAADSWRI